MLTPRIAIRNLFRNKRRTIITTGAMSFALAIMIIYSGLSEGFVRKFEIHAVSLDLSWIQIHAPGYRNDPSIYRKIDNPEQIILKLKAAGFEASPRLYGYALAAAGMSSAGVRLRGVDVARESLVTELYRHVAKGEWLSAEDSNGVVIGRKLAKTLGVSISDEIVILGQAADGSMANDLFKVKGILKTVSEEIDRSGFFMTIPAFRRLLALDQGVHEIVMKPPDDMLLEDAKVLAAGAAPGLEVLDWKQLQPALAQLLQSSDVSLFLLYIIAYAAIGMVILNAMLMAVFERIREFGIMKAIGISPWQIISMIFIETVLQTAMATAIGVGVGLPLSYYLIDHGINLAKFGGGMAIAGIAMDPVWSSHVTVRSVINPILFMMGIVLIAVIYPGIKAAMVRPIKAIYHR